MLTRRHADALADILALLALVCVALWIAVPVALWLEVMGEPPQWVSKGLVWAVVFGRLAVMTGRAVLRMWRE
jgi:uncharacterized protein (DUF983 family)